jgi:glutaconate CoA-transferase, subunit A
LLDLSRHALLPEGGGTALGQIVQELDGALAAIADDVTLAIPSDYAGAAMEATRALIRRGVKGLSLVTLPSSSFQTDLLIGAGAVQTIETSAVGFGELGPAPRFTAAVMGGKVVLKDATCPAIHAALRAAEMGNPFAPLRGIIGSDLLKQRTDWRVIDNPFAANDPVVLLPAIRPDVALFHAPLADRRGNVWVGRQRDLFTLAHASARSIATVEKLEEGNLLEDEVMAAATISAFYIEAVALVPRGAWPLKFGSFYAEDTAHILDYLALARSEEGFRRYLDDQVFRRCAA